MSKKKIDLTKKTEIPSALYNEIYAELVLVANGVSDEGGPLENFINDSTPKLRKFCQDHPGTRVVGLGGQPILYVIL